MGDSSRDHVRNEPSGKPKREATAPAQRGPRRPASTPCLRTCPTTPHRVGERRASRRGPGPGIRSWLLSVRGVSGRAVPTGKQRGVLGRRSATLGTTPSVGGAEGPLQGKRRAGGACRASEAYRPGISDCTWASRRAGALRLGVGAGVDDGRGPLGCRTVRLAAPRSPTTAPESSLGITRSPVFLPCCLPVPAPLVLPGLWTSLTHEERIQCSGSWVSQADL